MRINATGPGRKGTLDQGIGKLILKTDVPSETKQLKVIHKEMLDGFFGFWSALMWATQQNMLTKEEHDGLTNTAERIEKDWMQYVKDNK